eukprot:6839385-Pyramimonas_sp.AAC.1
MCRKPARGSWIAAGSPSIAGGTRQGRRWRRRHGGPALIQEIRADLREGMFILPRKHQCADDENCQLTH